MERQLTNPRVPIILILVAALGSVCFTIGAGLFLYRNTQKLVAARTWVEHTQEVLLSIQQTSQLVERLDAEITFYAATQHNDSLKAGQADSVRLQNLVVNLRDLISDNHKEDQNIQALAKEAEILHIALSGLDLPRAKQLAMRCQQTLSLMTEQENQLLRERMQASRDQAQISTASQVGVILLSILVLAALFGLMVRDVLIRAHIAREWAQTNHELEETNRELERTMNSLERHSHDATVLGAYRDELQLCASIMQVYRAASVRLPQLLPQTKGAIGIINNSRHTLETVTSWGDPAPTLSEVFPPDSCCGLRAGRMRWRTPGESEIDCTHFIGLSPARYVCVPLVAQGETLGILFVEFANDASCKGVQEHAEVLHQLVQLTAMAHASLELRSKLENQSIRDALTGLFNRHFMQVALDRELARATRRKSTLAVFMIDVDHFKSFNDRFSHAAGDTVLREVANVLQKTTRSEDIVCRYGGEEFTVILPEISEESALERADVLRIAVEALRTLVDEGLHTEITISIGIALFPTHGNTSETLLRQADAALYRAKNEGRNRACLVTDGATYTV